MPSARSLRVLLVEDDQALAAFLTTAIAGGDERVELSTVSRLTAALEDIRRLEPDAILLDLNLPDSQGLSTLTEMLRVAQHAPIVVLTGLDDEGLARDALKLGAQDWLVKGPVDPEVIQRSLRYAVERKKLADGLLRSQKLEVVGRLASGVAHEFNNVLTAIVGSAQLVELADDEEARHEALELLRRAAHQGTALSRQLLSLARHPAMNYATVDTSTLIAHALVLIQAVLPAAIRLEVGPVADMPVHLDAGQFDQLLLNLVLNARDAMPNGGVLRISVTAEERAPACTAGQTALSRASSYAAVHVSDTGSGIDPSFLPRIFQPFFTTKPRMGTGLGLAISTEIAERFGGAICVDSEQGSGATFSVYLPTQVAPAFKA